MEAIGSIMTNSSSDGYPGARYSGGTESVNHSISIPRYNFLYCIPVLTNDKPQMDLGMWTSLKTGAWNVLYKFFVWTLRNGEVSLSSSSLSYSF